MAGYCVIFNGRLVFGYEVEEVRQNLEREEAFDQQRLAEWSSGEAVVVAAGLNFEDAIELRERYAVLGAVCDIMAEQAPAAVTSFCAPEEPQDVPFLFDEEAPRVFEPRLMPAETEIDGLVQPALKPAFWFVITGGLYLFDWYYRIARELGQKAVRETLKLLIPGYNLVLLYRQLERVHQRVGGFSPAAALTWLVFWITLGLTLLLHYNLWWPVYFLAGLALFRVQLAINQKHSAGEVSAVLALAALIVLGGIGYGEYRLVSYNRTQLASFDQLDPGRYGDDALVLATKLIYLEHAREMMNDPRLTPASRYHVLRTSVEHVAAYKHGGKATNIMMLDYLRNDNDYVLNDRRARNLLNREIVSLNTD